MNSHRKIYLIARYYIFFILLVLARLFYLQIHQQDFFRIRGEKNFLKLEVLQSSRGDICDRAGVSLASSKPVFDLYWEGSGNSRLSNEQMSQLEKLKSLLGDTTITHSLLTQISYDERFFRRRAIIKDLHYSKLCLVSEQCGDFANLVIVNRFKRVYPYRSFASHILGYLGRFDQSNFVGRFGLEKAMQNYLEGQSGYALYVANAIGKCLAQKEYKQSVKGNDIRLTIDFKMQSIAETLFEKGQVGSFIVMDPETGALLSIVSYPNFDPNRFLEPISFEEWKKLVESNSPFLNRAICALYPPASIFKLVTFAAGIEEGIINSEDVLECKGYIKFCGRKYYCQRRWGHGSITCRQAIAHSCNIPCYEIAKRISIDRLAYFANIFGLGSRTNFLMSDSEGLVPTASWKAQMKGEGWWKGETLSSCIGQSYLLVTPIQIARMVAAISSGYLVKPRILEGEKVEKENIHLHLSTLDFLKEAMGDAVSYGTARTLRTLKDFKIAAKTGTAQTSSLDKTHQDSKFLEHGWFTCFFSYKDQKPLVLVAMVEHAGAARSASLLAKKFLSQYGATSN